MQQERKKTKDKVIQFTCVGILFLYIYFMVFGFMIVNMALLALVILFFVNYKQSKEQLVTYWTTNKTVLLILLSTVGFQFVHGAITGDLSAKRFGFLGLLIVSAFVLSWVQELKLIAKIFLFCITLLLVAGSYNIYNYYVSAVEFDLSSGGHIDRMLIVNRPYLGFMLTIGILTALYLTRIYTKYKLYYGGLSLLFLVYLVFIGNRIQVVSLVVLVLLYLLCYAKIKGIKKIGGFAFICLVVFLLFNYTPILKKRFELDSLTTITQITERLEEKEPRVLIWKCAWSFTQEPSFQPFFGVGKVETLENKLRSCYDGISLQNPMRNYFIDAQFNTHNQFIEYYVLTGIIGGGLLLSLFCAVLVKVRRYFIPTALTFALFNFCFVENLFNRQLGVYLFGFVLTFVLMLYQQEKQRIQAIENDK